uniref:uncharacterized protein LOC120339830 n=1 Tax=Styela clava TaxID=7725 RepID=UPI0019395A2E|nr:uncharacterized protein LOC120339830 [Styela clava]
MNYLNLITIYFLSIGIITFTNGDPCNRNFGRCDRQNGLCWGTGEDTHYCTCKAGFQQKKNEEGHECEDIDECKEEICDENAVCENTPGSYKCTCTCGYIMDYTGQYCLEAKKITDKCLLPESCYQKDELLRGFFPVVPFDIRWAKQYLTDYSTTTSYRPRNRARCDCEDGFYRNFCGFCTDIDECYHSNPCKGRGSKCVNTEGSFYCDCDPGYVIGPCKERCYRENSRVPVLCENPKIGVLNSQGFIFRSFARPILLEHFRTCPAGVENSDETTERFNLDTDLKPDVKLQWLCTGGVSTLKLYAEEEAHWESWSCWTECKATPWGGLQTRMRKCVHGLPSQEGCEGEGSQKRSCYTGPLKKFRIRKDATRLSDREKKDLIQAFEKYKNDGSARGFHNAASSHGWPNQCRNKTSCCPHGAKLKFITWHRSIMLHFEEGLNRYLKDKSIGMPYWNWLNRKRDPPSLGWDKRLYNAPNPFTNMTVLLDVDEKAPMRTIQRDNRIFTGALNFAHDHWLDVASKRKKPHILHEFAAALERAHGAPHVSVCGMGRRIPKCTISLGNLQFAAFDPLFWMHHCQVDRLWAVTQKEIAEEKGRGTTWTPQTALEALEERADFSRPFQPFGNDSLSPFPIVKATNTMRDSYYYEELTGIKYDSVDKNGFPPFMGRNLRRPPGQEVIFIGHYFQSSLVNFAVNYYFADPDNPIPCNRRTDDDRAGTAIKLGSARNFRQRVPDLTLVEQVGINADGALDIDFDIQACYTSQLDCTERCPELKTSRILSQPTPMLVYYMPNQPVDIYKFKWSEDTILPNWYINLHSGSQWIYFYGNAVNNITQVPSTGDYIACNARRGRQLTCHSDNDGGTACMLPSGIYYIINSYRPTCLRGQRMIVVSRK